MGEIRQKHTLAKNTQTHFQGISVTLNIIVLYKAHNSSYIDGKCSAQFLHVNIEISQKRLFAKPYFNPSDPVEVNLLLHQAIDDVVSDRYPVNNSEAVYLAALRAQVVLGKFSEDTNLTDYMYAADCDIKLRKIIITLSLSLSLSPPASPQEHH